MSTRPTTDSPARPAAVPPAVPRRSLVAGLIAGSLLVAVPPLVEYVADDFILLLPVALVLMLVALPGLRRRQHGADEPAGRIGLRLVNLGLLVAIVTVVVGSLVLDALPAAVQTVAEPLLMLVAAVAALGAVVGLVLLTVGMARARVYPLLAVVLFGPCLVLALVAEAIEQTLSGPVPMVLDVLPPTLFVASGLGLLGLSLAARSAASGSTAR